ncbi:hypothetical protein BWZ20_15065 [Winogradskyella sp. J14-2]|uniref:hypothetical protein n=1 Tax=Winogradskyella sp. J14-2 TaxID=1936080 RepID=UPI000972A06B|nr:hypothetical protein [Winogradskyella sp. J14-2]APY09540.1 hypothetical protein BWZ20_15065 [Winogradskyella sp. J14-2]
MRKDLNDEIGLRYLSDNRQAEYYFDLLPVEQSENSYHFRYIKSGQVIELYSDDAKNFKGQIVNFIQETKEVKTDYGRDNKPKNYVFEKIMIPEVDASKIGQFMLAFKSHKIPTDSLITDWNFNWLDCGIIKFKHKVGDDISDATFTCAHNQNDSVPYVSKIKKLKDTIANTFQLKVVFDEFTDKLPKGESYIIDGWINMYKLSQKQLEWWEKSKPIREYQKTIKDTIDYYLESELNRLIPNSTELDCFDEYRLTFNKNGRLRSMKVDMGFWERMFDKDYQKCRRILKKAFREIKIDFIDPKYMFYRDLSFGGKEIYITDPTLY